MSGKFAKILRSCRSKGSSNVRSRANLKKVSDNISSPGMDPTLERKREAPIPVNLIELHTTGITYYDRWPKLALTCCKLRKQYTSREHYSSFELVESLFGQIGIRRAAVKHSAKSGVKNTCIHRKGSPSYLDLLQYDVIVRTAAPKTNIK